MATTTDDAFGNPCQQSRIKSNAVPGEPCVFTVWKSQIEHLHLNDRIGLEEAVHAQVVAWLTSIGMDVWRTGHRVVGVLRDLRIEFWYIVDDEADLKHSECHKGWRVSVNNSTISSPTFANITTVRELAANPKKWHERADFRERARIHFRLTGQKLKPGKVK